VVASTWEAGRANLPLAEIKGFPQRIRAGPRAWRRKNKRPSSIWISHRESTRSCLSFSHSLTIVDMLPVIRTPWLGSLKLYGFLRMGEVLQVTIGSLTARGRPRLGGIDRQGRTKAGADTVESFGRLPDNGAQYDTRRASSHGQQAAAGDQDSSSGSIDLNAKARTRQ